VIPFRLKTILFSEFSETTVAPSLSDELG